MNAELNAESDIRDLATLAPDEAPTSEGERNHDLALENERAFYRAYRAYHPRFECDDE